MKRAAMWTLGTLLEWALLYHGAIDGQQWAANLYCFLVWIGLVFGLICMAALALSEPHEAEDLASTIARSPVPKFFRTTNNIAAVVVLAALGWWFTVAGYLLSIFVHAVATSTARGQLDAAKA